MRKGAEELRQKKLGKNVGYSIISNPKENPAVSTSYLAKTRIDPMPIKSDFTNISSKPDYNALKPRTEYISQVPRSIVQPVVMPMRSNQNIATELKSFMEDDDEEVSVAFDELMKEITKCEVNDNPSSK